MFLFLIYCVCLLLILKTSDSVSYPSKWCSKNDCSSRFQDFKRYTCEIYNTSVCLDFYKFDESSEEILTSEEESKFHVSILPYTAELQQHVTFTRSAINFTFTVNNPDIDELVVKMYKKKVSSFPVCRIFDFHTAENSAFPINLFYDCFYDSANHDLQNVRIDIISLPLKEKLSYDVFIPGTKYPESCFWQPLIMVFRGNLHAGVVHVKFSQAPELFNVLSYIVKLTQHPSGSERIKYIIPDISRNMLFTQFSTVDGGNHWISVKPVIWGVGNSCWTETEKFVIEIPKSYYMLTVYLSIFILLIFSAFVFLKMFRHNIAKLRFGPKQHILLLYSHDCPEHKDFVIAFIQYLKTHCHVEVSTIYDELPINWNPDEKMGNVIRNANECNPQEWIKKKYNECDIIMYLISAGLFHTLDDSKQNLPIKKYHEWRKQLAWATRFIETDIKNKKICQVCFPYSSKEYIPDKLRSGFGKCYDLPQQMSNLINFIHYTTEWYLCSTLCFTNFEASFKDTDLSKKMEAVQEAVDNNTHICIIKPCSNTAINVVIEEPANPEATSIISDSSDETSDFDINLQLGGTPESFSRERFAIDSNEEPVNFDESSTTSDENSYSAINIFSERMPWEPFQQNLSISKEKIANFSLFIPSDKIISTIKRDDFVDPSRDELVGDLDSEESSFL